VAKSPRQKSHRLNFTKHSLEDIATDPKQRTVYHDTRTDGLCLRVEPSGRKTFCWFRKINGRPTFKHIGLFPDLTVENARDKANEYNHQFARWKADEYQGESPLEPKRRDLTFTVVLEDYVARHLTAAAKDPARAARSVRWQFTKYVAGWKERKLGSVRQRDVLDLHQHVGDKHGRFTANRLVQLLRALYNWAAQNLSWKGENPARIKLYSEKLHQRTRFLRADELTRLFSALREEPHRDLRDFVVLSLFTGARMGDVLSARWENIQFDPPSWEIPNPKSRVPYLVPLMTEAVEILKQRQDGNSPWVFPGKGKTGHLTGFKHSWPELLRRAKITDLRVHDLRRTLGSWQAATGASLSVIGKSLGHQSVGSTQIYARLDLDPVRESVERATRAMLLGSPKKITE
jgi:integrase